jgi:hypothetical protein
MPMPFRDPVAAYNAASNLEAHFVCGLLQDDGIEAAVIEDISQVGAWFGGLAPQIHKPQVWIEREDSDRVGPILARYEQRKVESANPQADFWLVEVVCGNCRRSMSFPESDRGSVQSCRHCGAYLDVGEVASMTGWEVESEETSEKFTEDPGPEPEEQE